MGERITAMDVEQQEFKKKVRGYDDEEVRLYLKSIADEMGRLNLDNGEQAEIINDLKTRIDDYQDREKSLQNALVAAQKLSEEMVQKSRAEAELIVKEARLKSERMLQQAQEQLQRIEDETNRAKIERDTFERELRQTVEQHLKVLDMRKRDRGDGDFDNLRVLRNVKGNDA